MTEIEEKLAQVTAELTQRKGELGALIASWHDFLQMSWPEQQRLRELCPERIADLEREHFRKVQVPR